MKSKIGICKGNHREGIEISLQLQFFILW